MNDIEIFKKLKKNYNTLKKDYNAGHYSVYEMQFEDFEAIENLIQRNKNLEQIEKEHKKENGRLREELENIEYIKRSFDYCLEQKIKEEIELKVKEKIEELNKEEKKVLKGTKGQDRYSIKLEYMYKRNALQELLEESEK